MFSKEKKRKINVNIILILKEYLTILNI